jgi:hypothetical protein
MKPLARIVVHLPSMNKFQLISSRGLVVAAFLAIAAFQAGCVTVVDNTTPGSAVYIRGELQSNIDRRFEIAERAAMKAITELQFSKIEEKKDALVAIITARTAEDTRVTVKVERTSDTLSTIRIRAGVLGNEKLAYTILSRIKEAL